MPDDQNKFPRWETLYKEQAIESLPWFNPELHTDLKKLREQVIEKKGMIKRICLQISGN